MYEVQRRVDGKWEIVWTVCMKQRRFRQFLGYLLNACMVGYPDDYRVEWSDLAQCEAEFMFDGDLTPGPAHCSYMARMNK